MCAALDLFRYRLPYAELFGGAIAIEKSQFEMINGMSNLFYGWGGEDDDFYNRITTKQLKITRWSPSISRYTMLKHMKEAPNPSR